MVKIYVLLDPRDLRVRYVGVTSQKLNRRLTGHLGDIKLKGKNSYKINWLKELKILGLKPIIRQIEEVEHSEWEIREKYWYSYFKSKTDLTNSRDGGAGIVINRTDLSIERSSQAKFKTTYQFTLEGTFLKEWPCVRDAQLHFTGKTKGSIKMCLRGKSKSAYGYLWSYKRVLDSIPINTIPKRPLTVIYKDGTIKKFKSILEGASKLEVDYWNLYKLITTSNTITDDIVQTLQKCKDK